MKKTSNVYYVAAAVAVAVGSFGFNTAPALATGSYTWSAGMAGDGKFSTASNWAGGVAPTNGADLVFPCLTGAPTEQFALTNDLTGVKVASIATPSGVAGCGGYYKIDVIDFTATATANGSNWSVDSDGASVYVDTITGVSDLTANSNGSIKLHYKQGNLPYDLNSLTVTEDKCGGYYEYKNLNPANLIVGSGSALRPSGGSAVSVLANGTLGVGRATQDFTVTNNIVFEQGSAIGPAPNCFGSGAAAPNATVTLTGDIVLNGDVTYDLESNVTLKITGKLSGSGKLVAGANNKGVLNIAATSNTSGSKNGVVDTNTATTVKFEGDDVNKGETVARNTTATLAGKRAWVNVNEGGILKGTGTVDSLSVAGTVAPGNSPGTITVLSSFNLQAGGVYSAEVLNATEYDKIVAGSVSIDPAGELELLLVPGATVNKGDAFTIIDNTGTDPVTGAFSGLAEGAQVVVDGATFSISYKGGNGNDVVLTAMNDTVIPGVPNTGVAQLASNPVGVIASAFGALGVLVYMFKRK